MKPIRLGLPLVGQNPVPEMVEEARRAKAIGFDVVLLPDHLGFTAPLVPLVAIAEAAPTVKASNLVTNASFYRPALLARPRLRRLCDGWTADHLAGHRLRRARVRAAGLLFPSPEAELRKLTTLLDLPVSGAADRIQRLHEELGISYFTLNKSPGTSWETLEKLVASVK